MNKNIKVLFDFTLYCLRHPELRFWQALQRWSRFYYIIGFDSLPNEGIDTFYFKGKNK